MFTAIIPILSSYINLYAFLLSIKKKKYAYTETPVINIWYTNEFASVSVPMRTTLRKQITFYHSESLTVNWKIQSTSGIQTHKIWVTKVVQIIKCTCTVFVDNFGNISANSSIEVSVCRGSYDRYVKRKRNDPMCDP